MNAALMLLSLPSAHAWEHLQLVWSRDDIPLVWTMSTDLEDSLPDGYEEEVMQLAFDNWTTNAACANLSHQYDGLRKSTAPSNDGIVTIYWDDPEDQFDADINGVTLTNCVSGTAFSLAGLNYIYRCDGDIVFNDNITWGTSEDIEDGCSGDIRSIESTATHEVGHLWGLAHTCESTDICTDIDDLTATMYYQGGPCDTSRASPEQDDLDGLTALYGPYATFESPTAGDADFIFGPVPLEVEFELYGNQQALDEIGSVTWSFGDGETSTDQNPTHTYETQGQFSVVLDVEGTGDECGAWSFSYRKRAFVRACEPPKPTLDDEGKQYAGLFSYEHVNGLQYRLLNYTDTSVYGCVDDITWEIYKGDELVSTVQAWSPIVDLTEGVHGKGEGDYEVILTVKGPGGISQESLKLTAEDRVGEGFTSCSTLAGRSGAWALGLSVLVLASRRRED